MSASSPRPIADAATSNAADEKPIRYIIQNLERAYGVPSNERTTDPLDMLVAVVLSQATSDTNSHRTFAALKQRFPTWAAALRARETTIAATIKAGGFANQKAKVIKSLLTQIKAQHGTLDLSFLHELTADEAVNYLTQFRGIGPKTVACTLLFACRKDVFPLDTHIFRVLRRVGLIPQKSTDARAHATHEPPRPARQVLLLSRQPDPPRAQTLSPTRPALHALPHRRILRLRPNSNVRSRQHKRADVIESAALFSGAHVKIRRL